MGFTELVGLALAAAGTATGMKASSAARTASNREVENALLQQQQFQKEATPLFQQALTNTGADASKKNIESGADEARSLYSQVAAIPRTSSVSPLPIDEQRLSGQVFQSRENAAQGQGYRNWALQNWLQNQEASRNLGVISNLAGSAAGPTGTLAQLAQQKSAGLAGIGSLMSTAGNLAAIYGGLNSNRPSLLPPPSGASARGPWQNTPRWDTSTVS